MDHNDWKGLARMEKLIIILFYNDRIELLGYNLTRTWARSLGARNILV